MMAFSAIFLAKLLSIASIGAFVTGLFSRDWRFIAAVAVVLALIDEGILVAASETRGFLVVMFLFGALVAIAAGSASFFLARLWRSP